MLSFSSDSKTIDVLSCAEDVPCDSIQLLQVVSDNLDGSRIEGQDDVTVALQLDLDNDGYVFVTPYSVQEMTEARFGLSLVGYLDPLLFTVRLHPWNSVVSRLELVSPDEIGQFAGLNRATGNPCDQTTAFDAANSGAEEPCDIYAVRYSASIGDMEGLQFRYRLMLSNDEPLNNKQIAVTFHYPVIEGVSSAGTISVNGGDTKPFGDETSVTTTDGNGYVNVTIRFTESLQNPPDVGTYLREGLLTFQSPFELEPARWVRIQPIADDERTFIANANASTRDFYAPGHYDSRFTVVADQAFYITGRGEIRRYAVLTYVWIALGEEDAIRTPGETITFAQTDHSRQFCWQLSCIPALESLTAELSLSTEYSGTIVGVIETNGTAFALIQLDGYHNGNEYDDTR